VELVCTLEDCTSGEIVGTGVMLTTDEDEGIEPKRMMLHPNCFLQVFDELQKQEGMTTIWLAIAPVGQIKWALEGDD
jgi:hypothetical protein